MKKLAIVSSHPIQYNAPMFKLLSERGVVQIRVFYSWGIQSQKEKFDPGFQRTIKWDIPLLQGYEYEFLENISKDPGSHHFNGIINPSLNAKIEAWGAEAVLIFGWSFKSHLAAMRYFKGRIPVYFRGDSTMLDNISLLKRWIRRLFLRWVYTNIDKALYVGEANKIYFRKHGVKDRQLVFAPHAIDNTRFARREDNVAQANRFRENLGIPLNALVFLFAGKFEDKKGVMNLLVAFGRLNCENAHLVLVGNGELEDELKKMAKGNMKVHFMNFQNQSMMPAVYQIGDVFVLPSEGPGDTWGLAVNEAMAAGKAVVVSDVCGCAVNLVNPGVNGYIFSCGNRAELQSILQQFCDDPELAVKLGIAGLELIAGYNFEGVCKAIELLMNRHD